MTPNKLNQIGGNCISYDKKYKSKPIVISRLSDNIIVHIEGHAYKHADTLNEFRPKNFDSWSKKNEAYCDYIKVTKTILKIVDQWKNSLIKRPDGVYVMKSLTENVCVIGEWDYKKKFLRVFSVCLCDVGKLKGGKQVCNYNLSRKSDSVKFFKRGKTKRKNIKKRKIYLNPIKRNKKKYIDY
jgi:hypothetical protein